jgi:hypothetical protein
MIYKCTSETHRIYGRVAMNGRFMIASILLLMVGIMGYAAHMTSVSFMPHGMVRGTRKQIRLLFYKTGRLSPEVMSQKR